MPTFQITAPNGKKYRVTGDNPSGAMAALQKMIGADTSATVDPATNQPEGVPEYRPPGVEGYDPQTGEVAQKYSMPGSAAMGAADATTLGWGDEVASYLGSGLTGVPRDQVLSEMRGDAQQAQQQNPGSYLTGQLAGGVAQGIASGPATASAKFAGSTLLPRVAAGMADGGVLGGLYGAGSGTDASSRAMEGAKGLGFGAVAGGAFPLVSAGASKTYEIARNLLNAKPIAQQAGASPEALRLLGNVLDADGSLGPTGQANMTQAGQEAMLADAGPNARAVLDTAIQRGGPGAVSARSAIDSRVARSADDLTSALDTALGQPEGVTATRTAIRTGSAGARKGAYDTAYSQPIDYSHPLGQEVESIVKSRVPESAIRQANALMRANGDESKQILAHIADDGSVTFEKLPDVRQLDYITRALNDVASAENGKGQLGGTTALGRAYEGLSREIRDKVRDLVPEYGKALETAADPIQRSKAVELGSRLLSSTMTRDQAAEAVNGMTGAEKSALVQGVRSRIDDAMANVTRTVQDGNTDAREAIKALKDLSSRANREKVSLAIGEDKASALFKELDRVATSFNLRSSVAENSKTYARQATDQRVKDLTGQGGIYSTAKKGEALNATKRVIQALTGETPEKVKGREDAVFAELARLLTRSGGAGPQVYDAIGKIGQTDQATALMSDRIARALLGTKLSYPAATLGLTYTGK